VRRIVKLGEKEAKLSPKPDLLRLLGEVYLRQHRQHRLQADV
jgi:hypothetical protein